MSDIETDFQAVADQINAKIKEAGELIKQANAIARSVGVKRYTYSNNYSYSQTNTDQQKLGKLVSFDPILDPLDQAGWKTSSMTADC